MNKIIRAWRKNDGAARWRALPAFTMIELLVVICIISILIGIIVPSFIVIRGRARYVKDKVAVKNLETAFKQYLDQYQVWPPGVVIADNDDGIEISGELFRMLQGENVSPDYPNPGSNSFFEFERAPAGRPADKPTNAAYDAWSSTWDNSWEVYRARFDVNYDNMISDGDTIRRSVIVWSVGANRVNEPPPGAGDDIRSWE